MVNGKQIIFPTLVGLSLCSVGAYFVYLYFRKDEDDDILLKKSSMKVTFEMKIPSDLVPALVGRGGCNIKELQEKSHCRINFKDQVDEEEHRVCVIRGSADNVHLAELLITEFLRNVSLITFEEISVPQKACGRIIGRCGENIQKIMRSSNAKVDIDTNYSEQEQRKIKIKGTPEQIAVAKSLIETHVMEDEEIRRNLAQRQPRGPPKISPNPSPAPLKKETPQLVEPLREKFAENGQIDGQIEVYVSAVDDPGKFWVQIVGPKANELDQLVDQMTEYYNKDENAALHKLNEISVGEIVAARFEFDKKWYRAEVTKIAPNPNSTGEQLVSLYFVDYGDTAVVKMNEAYELRTDFLRLRFQAIECFLANVEPTNGTEWSEESIDLFEELTHVAQWKKLWSKIVCYKERTVLNSNRRARREGSPIPGIRLYGHGKNGDFNVAEELVKAGLANVEPDKTVVSPRSPRSPRASSEHKDLPIPQNRKSITVASPILISSSSSTSVASTVTEDEDNKLEIGNTSSDLEFFSPINGNIVRSEKNANIDLTITNNATSTPELNKLKTRNEKTNEFLDNERRTEDHIL